MTKVHFIYDKSNFFLRQIALCHNKLRLANIWERIIRTRAFEVQSPKNKHLLLAPEKASKR
ncbi:hypothetical protein HMPREF1991_01866 [Hoylesella loescheii DSM 19665 = JCM 12249 = ATCC 15930]|uniref:Uncharacterized protein n=1 Tax=Hoylesella loescheii DSM 19665 = JCM 12249 = ATCC 15930 TaxID=1122985 RepID=A0A069QH32_HOYLO|nr:hypothetical protein HMPREF1991_01866 [Hoylesella loescheii DSM 19665 = JCM 12249 = ATCC 15930]